MADDASYAAFLSKANEPTSQRGTSTSQTRCEFDPTSQPNAAIPAPLANLPKDRFFVSDTDSPFEPVFINYSGSALPSVSEFRKCLNKGADSDTIDLMTVEEWDPQGQYGDVVDAVRQAGDGGQVSVYRLQFGATRAEYYVLTLGDRKLLGVFTRAVES